MAKDYYMNNQQNILDALYDEQSVNKQYCEYTIESIKTETFGVYSGNLKIKHSRSIYSRKIQIDEIMIGGKIWWENDGATGYAEIFLVIPEDEKVIFRFVHGNLPEKGTTVRIYLPDYIEPLIKCWENSRYVAKIDKWFKRIENQKSSDNSYKITGEYKNWLRKNQKEAFALMNMSAGLLWGPPGTGKTTTMSAIIAEYVQQNPYDNVLIVANTNLAVDTIFTGFDKILDKVKDREKIRKKSIRFGQYFNSGMYKGREYMLSKKDETFILEELFSIEEERQKTPNEDVKKLALLKKRYDALKEKLKKKIEDTIQNYSIVAMTSTVALNYFDDLISNKFNLVILEEASQINICQALMLTLLGDKVIYTGDNRQLSPIVQSKNKNTKKFLGSSIFKLKTSVLKDRVFFLNEQSRMTKNICKIVSDIFYDKKLLLASRLPDVKNWKKERKLYKEDIFHGKDVAILDIDEKGTWSQKYGGIIRHSSAVKIDEICKKLVDNYDCKEEDITILTPFRAQKNMIKGFLRRSYLKKIHVKTIHKSQGSEAHTIIFDPVDGNNNFLKTEEARNMINVALSRAKARLVVCLHEDDFENNIFFQVGNLIAKLNSESSLSIYPEIDKFIKEKDYPQNIVGKIINFHKSGIFKVEKIEENKIYVTSHYNSNLKSKFSVEGIKRVYS